MDNIKFKTKIDFFSMAGVLVVAGIIVMVNILANYAVIRVDLTKNNIYSLSPASKRLLRKLDDRVLIKAYFTKNITPPYSTHRDYLKDLLAEYKSYSRGRVNYAFVPDTDEDNFLQEARSYGIPSIRFQEIRKDKFEVKEGVMGLVILFEDKSEVIPVIRGIESLEYDLTSRILKLTRDSKKTLGIITGFNALDITEKNQEINENLRHQYDIVKITMEEDEEIPENIDALIFIGPQETISQEALFAIDQSVMKGRPLFAAVNGFSADLERFTATELRTGLEELVKSYGAGLKPGMVIDASAQNIAIRQQQGFFSIQNIVPYFFVPLVTDISKDSPVIKDLEAISTPFVKAIDFDPDNNKDIVFNPLARSSQQSWVKTIYNISPYSRLSPGAQDELKPEVLIATLEGSFKSHFTEKEIPEKFARAEVHKESVNNRILVSGSGYMFNDSFPIMPSNMVFLLNAIDWVIQDEALIGIRSKDIKFRPIGEVANWKRVLFKNANLLLMPFLLVIFGLFRWKMRKNYRLKIRQEFSSKP